MATSLGTTAAESCAAARAGLSRTTDADLEVEDPETGFGMPIPVHVLGETTDGFVGVARLARLAALAIDDVLESSGLDPEVLARGSLVLHVRDSFLELVANAEDASASPRELAQQLADSPLQEELEVFDTRLTKSLLHGLARRLGIAPTRARLIRGGAAAFIEALEAAAESLEEGDGAHCVVGSVDAPADPEAMELWGQLGMLKSPENPVGVVAGEAAAFLVLHAPGLKGAPKPLATIDGWASGRRGPHRFSGELPHGRSLHDALKKTWDAAGRPLEVATAIANLGGDEYRAHEYGGALALQGKAKLPSHFDSWFPATAFGETGAATAAVSAGMAVRAIVRKYSGGPDVIVAAMSDDGAAGAFVVCAPRGAQEE